MKVYEFLEKHAEILRECAMAGVTIQDLRNLPIFKDMQRLRNEGLKMEYCVDYVVQKYAISRTTAYRIAKEMLHDIKI